MEASDKTACQMYEEIKAKPTRPRFGFGRKPALVNIDLQKAYTCVDEFATAYETDPKQIDYVNRMSEIARSKGLPVVWTHVAYMESGEDCGVWGTRTDTPDSLQNIKVGSRRSEFDDRLVYGWFTEGLDTADLTEAKLKCPLWLRPNFLPEIRRRITHLTAYWVKFGSIQRTNDS